VFDVDDPRMITRSPDAVDIVVARQEAVDYVSENSIDAVVVFRLGLVVFSLTISFSLADFGRLCDYGDATRNLPVMT
jgi:hypothetical protein